jgi:hypothetical protein
MDNLRLSRVTGTTAALGAAGQVTLNISTATVKVRLRRVKVKHVSGAAATFTPTIFKASAATSGSIDQEFVGSSTVVADLFDVVADACTYTDTNGDLFLRPVPSAGADNVFQYEVYFEVIR